MAKKSGELTPMMKQFFDFKAKYPEALLLFRCGDFYETYCEDAERAAKVLGITLTRRNNGASQGDAMAGFPYHALDTYLPRLIRAGIRVAICDQLEDPKKTKTLVKRGVTELVTPGVVTQDNVLNTKENNFLCALHFGKGALGISLLDLSTGEFLCGEGSFDYCNKIIEDFQPKEVIYNRDYKNQFITQFSNKLYTYELDDWVFTLQTASQKLNKHFKVRNLKGFGVDHLKNGIIAAGAILQYLELTQHNNIAHITNIQRLDTNNFVRMDGFTLRSLELLNPMSPDGVSLLQVIDRTATPMGGRLLRRWLTFPLKDAKQIIARHETVEYYLRNPEFRDLVDDQLHRIADLERIVSKISTGRVSPREMRQLAQALDAIAKLKYQCAHTDRADLIKVADIFDPCTEMKERIEREIVPEPPLQVGKGGTVIQRGVNPELDDYRDIQHNGKAYLVKMQQEESDRTGIASLKIGYNNVFGYYLEVRNTYKDKVPETWIRKQTLAQAERYITPELKEYEDKILTAESKIDDMEVMIFNKLVNDCSALITQIQRNAIQVARLDCLLSFALTSMANRYIRPVIDNSTVLDIKEGRHPVIEQEMEIGEQYIPNDVKIQSPQSPQSPLPTSPRGGDLKNASADETSEQSSAPANKLNVQNISKNLSPSGESEGGFEGSESGGLPQIMIITGPNMAGKSALLRQTALIVILAQIGCFVPATSARIGVVDRIFTRVGASDNIAHGESTFMVEMTEASNILNNVTDRSLVLFDELGRGTSTYDGISIAWAIVEYLADKVRPRTLFATHYHELNEMESKYPNIKNYNVSVREADGRVIFLRKLVEGGSAHSFGIHVAEMAGMPRQIVKRANTILHQLEAANANVSNDAKESSNLSSLTSNLPSNTEMSFFQLDDPVLTQIRDTLLHLDVNNLTPIQALNKLNEIKGILKG